MFGKGTQNMLKIKEIKDLANKALNCGNPYKKNAIMFYKDRVAMYIYAETIMTEEEIDNAYIETAMHDIKEGFNQRMVGYYDKWYRYNHADEGRAYDLGVKRALQEAKCEDTMNIIECIN